MDFTFSVIIRAYNAEKYIQDAVYSILNQKCRCPIEIIILYDEGSTDNTLEKLEELQKMPMPENIALKIIRHPRTTPFRALQIGFREARGEYVTILDYDNMYPPEYLETILQTAEKHPEATFLFSKAYIFTDNQKTEKALVEIPEDIYDIRKQLVSNHIDVNTQIFKKSCKSTIEKLLEKLNYNYFDWIFEDWLIATVALKFCKPLYVKDAYVLYRVHGTNVTYMPSSQEGNLIKRLYNIDRSIKTLIAMLYIFNDREIDLTITTSLIDRYLLILRFLSRYLHVSRLRLLLLINLKFIKLGFAKLKYYLRL